MSYSGTITAEQYVQHHLEHLTLNLNTMTLGNRGFWTLNLDTLGVSIVLGVMFLGVFRFIATRMVVGVPGHVQNFVEIMFEFVQKTVKETFHGRSELIAPLSLTLFIWVFLMNFMDLLPVDLLPRIMALFGYKVFRAVPTADPMATFAMSVGIFILIIFYNFRIKGLEGSFQRGTYHAFWSLVSAFECSFSFTRRASKTAVFSAAVIW